MKKPITGRPQFNILDILRAATGIEREGGYTILRQEVTRQVEDEIERLYAIEEEAAGLVDLVDSGVRGIMPSGWIGCGC